MSEPRVSGAPSPRKCFARSGDPKNLAKEASARRAGQYNWYDQATRAKHPAASVVSPRRSPALPGGSRRRPGARG
jgi:hypothetical protein